LKANPVTAAALQAARGIHNVSAVLGQLPVCATAVHSEETGLYVASFHTMGGGPPVLR
jgi:hypothetical protein